MPIFECRALEKRYGAAMALDHIDLALEPGRIVGLLGPNGSGKSTLLRLFMRFWDAGSGKITFGGADIRSVNTAALRSQESFVTQDTELFADTIENNVRIANRNATHEQVVEACQKASLHDFITSLPQGYGTQVGELGGALSGGERQRIGVARAFLHDAPFVLMDEPTSALDPISTSKVEELALELKDRYTIVIVTHNMQQAARISDKTAFFLLGELVEMGDTERLFSTPVDKRTEDYISGRFG